MCGEEPDKMPRCVSIVPDITALSLNDLMAFIDIIGTAATTPAIEDEASNHHIVAYRAGLVDHTLDLERFIRRIEAAGEVMADWPSSYQRLLGNIAYRNTSAQSHLADREAFATRIGATVLFPRRSINGTPLSILQDQMAIFCASRLNITRRKRNLATQDARARAVQSTANMSALARKLGLRPQNSLFQRAYRTVINELPLDEEDHGVDELAARLQESVIFYLQKNKDSISATDAASILEGDHLDRSLNGWDHIELLQKIPKSIDFFGKRRSSYRLSETLSLHNRFLALAKPAASENNLLAIPIAMRMFLTKSYKKTDFLLDFSRGILNLYRSDQPTNVFDLLIDPEQVRSLLAQRELDAALQSDKFLRLGDLNRLTSRFRGKDLTLTPARMKRLRDQELIRFQQEDVFDGRRFHLSYKYHVGDAWALLTTPQLEKLIMPLPLSTSHPN